MKKRKLRLRPSKWGAELPNQLEVRGGKLVLRETGEEPIFDIPDGTSINLVPRDHMAKLLDQARMFRCLFGA